MKMIKLTTPEGKIYIHEHAIIAIAAVNKKGMNGTTVLSEVWIAGQQASLPFNILEDVGVVFEMLH